jgi:hypothetical protein
MATIRVSTAFQTLFCFHGADEGESEPYLWTIMFTIDGRTITHAPGAATLSGGPAFFFSPGSHGNLGGGINTGQTKQIPRAVGRFDTTLQPIVISIFGRTVEVPGQIGMLAVLLEENATSDEGAEAAHQAINDLVRVELEEGVADLNVVAIAAEAEPAVTAGTDPVEAVMPILRAKMDRVANRIQRVATDVAIATIVRHLSGPGAIVEGLDPDEFMGTATRFFSQEELEATTTIERLKFTDTIAQPGVGPLEASEFIYNLHSAAWQRVEVFFTPVTEDVPAGRWQVTGIARGGSTSGPFLSHIGGHFPDGSPWVLPKGTAMDLIAARTHSFFVRGADGREAEVVVDQNEENPGFPFLTTVADDDPSNNLAGLPPCQLAIRQTRDVDD